MTITQSTPPQSAPANATAQAMAAGQPPQWHQPGSERPATENAAPEVTAVAVLGYN